VTGTVRRRPRPAWRRPRVSVIIASYRWPEALELSLASALEQTFSDLEVLVVEDGPDQASKAVVRAARDHRVRWHGLPRATGSQSSPNAYGWRRARGAIVAYLGHDDIWHPDHLSRLTDALGPGIDAAHAIALCLREGGGEQHIAGSEPWSPGTFVPPSSLAHWRDSARLGAWQPPGASGLPVDYAFLMACHERGARFETTGEPTAFKYPAAWRIDCYRTRDVTPQRRLRERLARDPDAGELLLHEIRASGMPPNLGAPPEAEPGAIADHNRRLKGLPGRFGAPVTQWRPDQLPLPGWHPAEHDGVGPFAWTGPASRAFVRLDPPSSRGFDVRVVVRYVVSPDQLECLSIDVDGAPISVARSLGPYGATVLTGSAPAAGADRQIVEVGLTTQTRCPRQHDPASPDDRVLGVAVAEIALLPTL
jgi:Glycosyl transferase family 2